MNLAELTDTMLRSLRVPDRNPSGPFLYSIDHCFHINGQGTIVTGTVLSGSASVGDVRDRSVRVFFFRLTQLQTIEFPALKVQKKIKSMQMFKKQVQRAKQGDRVGMCIANLQASAMERGIACSVGGVVEVSAAVVVLHKVPFFKRAIPSKAKFHGARS